jgi:hypothetical protein
MTRLSALAGVMKKATAIYFSEICKIWRFSHQQVLGEYIFVGEEMAKPNCLVILPTSSHF